MKLLWGWVNEWRNLCLILTLIKEQCLSLIHIFSYVSYELRNDSDFMMNAISKNAETIEFASYELRNDEDRCV